MSPIRCGSSAAVFFFAVAQVATVFCANSAFAQREPTRYCRPDRPAVVLALDITTKYESADEQLLLDAVRKLYAKLEGGERIVIRTLTESFSTSERLFEGCVPACFEKSRWRRALYCSTGGIETDDREMKADIERTLHQRLLNFRSLPTSDIVRTLAHIAEDHLGRSGNSTLYVFSDLIENSELVSGKRLLTSSTSELMKSLRSKKMYARLQGVDVKVFGIGRASRDGRKDERRPLTADEEARLRQFWHAYFVASKARSISISRQLQAD